MIDILKYMKYVILIFLFVQGLTISAQRIRVIGIVQDSVSKEPIPYTSITVVNSGIGTYSNADGQFELTVVDNTEIRLKFSSIGYLPQLIKLSEIDVSKPLTVTLKDTPVLRLSMFIL